MIKKTLISLFIIVTCIFPIAGCETGSQTSTNAVAPSTRVIASATSPLPVSPLTSSTPPITISNASASPAHASSPGSIPAYTTIPDIDINLVMPVLPKPGETVNLTLDVKSASGYFPKGTENSKAWIEFNWSNTRGSYSEAKYATRIPVEEVVVSGKSSWEGDLTSVKNIQLNCKIRLPREGVWQIMGYFSGEGWKAPTATWLYFGSLDGYAVDLMTYGGRYNEPSYLRNFKYGQSNRISLSELRPVILEADISKLPLVGEEAIITCRIQSLYDVPDFSALFMFFKGRLDANGEGLERQPDNLLVKGDLSWQGDLKAGQTVEFSAVIKFPEARKWHLNASGDSPEREKIKWGIFADNIYLNIANNLSSYGWEER
jgi:hypothetical protein